MRRNGPFLVLCAAVLVLAGAFVLLAQKTYYLEQRVAEQQKTIRAILTTLDNVNTYHEKELGLR